MSAPTGCSGVHSRPKSLHWTGFSTPFRTSPHCAALGSVTRMPGTSKIRSASQSALGLREQYADYDAERRFRMPGVRVTDPKAAQCGEVLKGVLKPHQCKLFGRECTPEHPVGALMVSSEGACAAYYNFALRKGAPAGV